MDPIIHRSLPADADLDFVLPTASPEGIAAFRELYREKTGKDCTGVEAGEALQALMTIIWNLMSCEQAVQECEELRQGSGNMGEGEYDYTITPTGTPGAHCQAQGNLQSKASPGGGYWCYSFGLYALLGCRRAGCLYSA